MADKIISAAVKGIASGIGLASESITAHKNKKRAGSQPGGEQISSQTEPNDSISSNYTYPEEQDEDQWALDDVQDELIPALAPTTSVSPEKPITDVKILIDMFIQTHLPPNYAELPPTPRLPYPVVLPQRRPKNRSRGFIRAYAPVLMNAGIDQASFLDYLELFDKASQASPWLNAINLAGLAFSFLPSGISIAISVAITISVKVAMEMQSRSRQNTFLDRLNAEYFRPRGLFCLVLTWNPESSSTHDVIDITSTANTSTPSKTQKLRHKFQASSGSTYGELQFPEVAALIFPALDNLASQPGAQASKTRDKLKKKSQFVDSYWDKRAQARYAAKNPDSMLAQGPKPEFTSRYADPNHPASSGNLFSLISGGHFNPPSLRDMQQQGQVGFGERGRGLGAITSRMGGNLSRTSMDERQYQQSEAADVKTRPSTDRRDTPEHSGSRMTGSGLGAGLGGLGGFNAPDLLKKGVKKVMGKNVYYLTIVNMPTDAEMAVANEQADAAEQEARRQM